METYKWILIKALSKWFFKIEHTANFFFLDKLVVDQLLKIFLTVPFVTRKNPGLCLVSIPVRFSVQILSYRRQVCRWFLVKFSDHNFVPISLSASHVRSIQYSLRESLLLFLVKFLEFLMMHFIPFALSGYGLIAVSAAVEKRLQI